jgi:hypothetical protein
MGTNRWHRDRQAGRNQAAGRSLVEADHSPAEAEHTEAESTGERIGLPFFFLNDITFQRFVF